LQVGFGNFISIHHGSRLVERGQCFCLRATTLRGFGEQSTNFVDNEQRNATV
jgi:hypothetical protein